MQAQGESMAKQPLYNAAGQAVGEVDLPAALFEVEPNHSVVHQAVLAHLAGARSGTAKAKTRGEIRGGGHKPWRQKGTGRARHGSRRSPIWVHGGQIFPPRPRSYEMGMPRKMRRLAFVSGLSAAAAEGRIRFVDRIALEATSTRALQAILHNLELSGEVLLVAAAIDEHLGKSAGNLAELTLTTADALSTYDLVAYDSILMTRDALARLEETRR
jgi:large subunit ribosomal protein L4